MWLPFKSGSMQPRRFQFEIVQELFLWYLPLDLRSFSSVSRSWGHLRKMERLIGNSILASFSFQFKIAVFQRNERLAWITAYCLEFQYLFKKDLRSTSCEPSTEVPYVFKCPRSHALWGRQSPCYRFLIGVVSAVKVNSGNFWGTEGHLIPHRKKWPPFRMGDPVLRRVGVIHGNGGESKIDKMDRPC